MDIEFNPAKNEANIAKHGLSFVNFKGFDVTAAVTVDDRFDYGETRYRAFGRIAGSGYAVVFTVTVTGIRLISLRRAHEKEMRRYE